MREKRERRARRDTYSYRQFLRFSLRTPGTMTTRTHTKENACIFSKSLAAKVGETNNYTLSWGSHIILF